ncbi:MAG: MFS transporter, partial [Chloroflexi bacterium]
SPLAGEIADRYRKRTVLLITQSSFVLPPLALFALTATGQSQYWEIILAALATGAINALDVPCRQAFQVEMVGKQDLLNAIALNSSVFNASAVIGPSIAG